MGNTRITTDIGKGENKLDFLLEKKIKEGVIGLFLIPFCNQLNCEVKIKENIPAYSIRCIDMDKKVTEFQKCLFCQSPVQNMVYLGRSY